MNKKIITPILCMHLLITPQIYAWQMPKLDEKQMGIIAVVTAAVLSIIGIAWYKHAKRGNQRVMQTPVVDRSGLEALQPDSRNAHLPEINTLREEVSVFKREIAVIKQQIGQMLGKLGDNEHILAKQQEQLDHLQKLLMGKSLVSGEIARKVTRCEGLLNLLAERMNVKADDWVKFYTPDKLALQEGLQSRNIAKREEELAKQKQEKVAGAGQPQGQQGIQKTIPTDHTATMSECDGAYDRSTFIALRKPANASPSVAEETQAEFVSVTSPLEPGTKFVGEPVLFASDFERSLTVNRAELRALAVSVNGLQALSRELDAPVSAVQPTCNGNGVKHKRSMSR